MYFYIESLKQRLDAINQLRIDRALATMRPISQQVYKLLPILLHYHHPVMPGYFHSNVPNGICFYEPDNIQQYYLKKFKMYHNVLFKSSLNNELPIIGIYSMGSTSSIGQNYFSDLDIWVCHQSWLDNKERQLLSEKCSIIENWAALLGVEVNFFLIDENQFRYNKKYDFNSKSYSFSQHILLLDEFYRSAVRLAGKRILWNIIPGDKEEYYDDYVMALYSQRVLVPDEWLDLGSLNYISTEEYCNASLWQIYKSFNSPYKALLKTLLLEAYLWEHPKPRLLSKDIKQRLHNGEIVSFGLDPYCMMLEHVTTYLQAIDDITRLDLVRRCFYLKVCEKLSHKCINIDWRRKIVSQLVKKWGWDNTRLVMLDNHTNWQINQVHEIHKELSYAMMYSYHNIINFYLS